MIPHSPQLAPSLSLLSSPSTILLATDSKKHIHRLKQFHYKYGRRQHPYDKEKAPYPVCYDRDVLEMQVPRASPIFSFLPLRYSEALDNRLIHYLRGSVSFVSFNEHPQRVLDLGCGTGTWVIEAAKQWPDCHFIGFDLVDVQLPLRLLDATVATRIEWRHGNFLTSRLPFDDDEFDHVHLKSIAQGVPENKWGMLFEEINRVLRPGGSVEVIEEDMIFPWLPRWFTDALRKRPFDGLMGKEGGKPELLPKVPPHDHALLEALYRAVFEHRFINVSPTSVLPSYLTTYFRQVTLGPIVSFPMPPLPPIQPLPTELSASFISEPLLDLLDPGPSPPTSPIMQMNRPISLSFSSSLNAVANGTATVRPSTSSSTRPRTSSAPFAYTGDINSPQILEHESLPAEVDITTLPVKRFIIDDSLSESERAAPDMLFPMAKVACLSCQEAMWEELKDMIRNRPTELVELGWSDDESGELGGLENRKRFEKLVDRYKSDIRARMSLWCSLEGIGWPVPPREPLTKAELVEEKRLRERMIEARKLATVEDMHVPCRSVRVILGYKL